MGGEADTLALIRTKLYRTLITADQQLRLTHDLEPRESVGIARYSLGASEYCRNELAAVEKIG